MPTQHTGTWQGVRDRGITANKVETSDQMRKKLNIGIQDWLDKTAAMRSLENGAGTGGMRNTNFK